MNDIEALSREFCKQNGICWHDFGVDELYCIKCSKSFLRSANPDFSDAREVLKVMRSTGRLDAFMLWLWDSETVEDDLAGVLMAGESFIKLLAYVEDTTGLMLQEAVEYLRRGNAAPA